MLIDLVVKYYHVSYKEATEIIESYRVRGKLEKLLSIVTYER